MKSTDNLYTFINFFAFDTAPGFSKISFLLARNLYHVIFYYFSITLEFKFKRYDALNATFHIQSVMFR